ncbi:Transposase [Adhaeretor mobilis]|uniref:Transposase n=1 Tax=Adhaeretor mobilis TaxID=1930276 RepID=A0A517MQM8_9BACT|nr:Transposase [Adhaeretor mobilis]
MESIVIGIDVAKQQLDVATPKGVLQAPNTPEGHRHLMKQLANWSIDSIIVEATGGYERAVVAEMAAANLPIIVVNPRQVRDFARATGQLAKTDSIDAQMLAQFGQVVRPEQRPLPSKK